MKLRAILTVLSAWMLIATLVPPETLAGADSVRIGVMLPLTGHQARFGSIQHKSVLMAAGEINAAGGVNGKRMKLVVADTQGNPDAARAAVEKLIRQDKVLVIGGGLSSSATWAAIPIAQKNKLPFLVNSAEADKITEQGWEYIFRLNSPLSERLDAAAAFLSTAATDVRSVAIVHANTLENSAAARRFSLKAAALNLKRMIREGFEAGVDDFGPLLTRIKAKNPDLIYAVADRAEDAALLVHRSKALGLNPKLFMGEGRGFLRSEFARQAGNASDYVVCSAIWTPQVPYRGAGAFDKKFIAAHKVPPEHYGAEAYAGITVIADAIKRTKVLAPEKVRDALAKTDLMTVLGPVKFVSYHSKSRQNRLPAFLVQWINGQLRIVWPEHLATKKFVYPVPK